MVRKALLLLPILALTTAAVADGVVPPGLVPASELVAAAKGQITEIDAATLARKLAGKPVLVDVRESYEFREGHIPGSVNIPRGRLEFDILDHPALAWISDSEPDALADTEIVVYCRSGGRAALAAQSLQSLGFRHVRSLEGGFNRWREASYPVEE